jgi:broad specificity phosphatase PhoE
MPDDLGARADRIIAEVAQAEGVVALVAHGHMLRVLGARWVEESPAFGARLFLATGTVSVLGFERDTRVLRAWNQG